VAVRAVKDSLQPEPAVMPRHFVFPLSGWHAERISCGELFFNILYPVFATFRSPPPPPLFFTGSSSTQSRSLLLQRQASAGISRRFFDASLPSLFSFLLRATLDQSFGSGPFQRCAFFNLCVNRVVVRILSSLFPPHIDLNFTYPLVQTLLELASL